MDDYKDIIKLICIRLINDQTFHVLRFISKNFYHIISIITAEYGIKNYMSASKLAAQGYLNLLKWDVFSVCTHVITFPYLSKDAMSSRVANRRQRITFDGRENFNQINFEPVPQPINQRETGARKSFPSNVKTR